MFGWPVGDRLAEPPTHQPYLFCFSLSLAKSSKDNEESQDGALEVRRGKNKRLRGPCQQQQINTEVTDVLWAPSAHEPRRFKITHVAPSAGTASLRFVTFPAIWIIRGGLSYPCRMKPIACQCNSACWITGLFPWSADMREHVTHPFLAPALPGSLLAPKFPRLRSGPRATRQRAGWNMPFGELLLFQSHFRCGELQ